MKLTKKGNVNIEGLVVGVVLVIVAIIVIFNLVGASSSSLTTAATNISSSGLPLASLFAANGIVLLIFMAGILIAVISIALKMHKGGR